MSGFDTWWYNEGSEMRPLDNEDMEEFAKRITEIAWRNGAYKATHTPLTDEQIGKAWSVANDEHNATASVKRRITRSIESMIASIGQQQ